MALPIPRNVVLLLLVWYGKEPAEPDPRFVALVAVAAVTAAVALPTVTAAGSVHCGAVPVEVSM